MADRPAALIPPPHAHRHRYHGVLAPYDALRAAVKALAPEAPRRAQDSSRGKSRKQKYIPPKPFGTRPPAWQEAESFALFCSPGTGLNIGATRRYCDDPLSFPLADRVR